MVAITFDDGPDPRYTPQILDILERYRVKACFFMIGSKAKAYPELTSSIARAGHEIGNHGFNHKAAWLLGPGGTTKEITAAEQTLEALTGQNIRFCRPPWGLFNLVTIIYCRLKRYKLVLWTYMNWDWTKRATSKSIARTALGRVKDGSILIFHDSDSTPCSAKGSPARVVAALPGILEELSRKGLRVVPLEEIITAGTRRTGVKNCARGLWSFTEKFLRMLMGIKEIEEGSASVWRTALRRYRGKDWKLPDGTVLRRGDRYLELHLNNERLRSLAGENTTTERMAITALREIQKGLPALARLLHSEKEYHRVKALIGITLLHRGTKRLGFTTYDLKPGLFSKLTRYYEKFLLALFHPGGHQSLRRYREELTPKYVVITREELMRRYENK
jgi:peptidoglycan/xylan/chitin deacetylase (PgdA/CDA1 family)